MSVFLKRWFCTHAGSYAEIVHFTNGSSITVICEDCARVIGHFSRIEICQNDPANPIPAVTTIAVESLKGGRKS